jgi:hypothetical protein
MGYRARQIVRLSFVSLVSVLLTVRMQWFPQHWHVVVISLQDIKHCHDY